MNSINEMVEKLVDSIEEVPADTPVSYEVWAIGYDDENKMTDAEVFLETFTDPDLAVNYAKAVSLADVVHRAADDSCKITDGVCYISIEVETVVADENDTMNVGTVFKKVIEIF